MNTEKIYKYTISVRPWPELNGETSYACCFFNSKTRKKNALIPMKAGKALSETQWMLFDFYVSHGWTFVVTFETVALAAAFFEPIAAAKAERKKELVEQSRMPSRKQVLAASP